MEDYERIALEVLEALKRAEKRGLDLEDFGLRPLTDRLDALLGDKTADKICQRREDLRELFRKRKVDEIKFLRVLHFAKGILPDCGNKIPNGSLEEKIRYVVDNTDPDELKEIAARTLGWTGDI